MGPVLVFGHRNPDNDSICSAVAYAHLKNLTDTDAVFVPARLGPVPPETRWVFERFGVDLPAEIGHVRTRVRDAMTPDPATIRPLDDLLMAGKMMRERGVRSLPVVDEDGTIRGLLNQRILAELYISETEMAGFEKMPLTAGQLARALGGELLAGREDLQLAGRVLIGAMEPETMRGYIARGDTVIVGDRKRTQPLVLEAGASCLIISGGSQPDTDVLGLARSGGAAIISSPHDTYATARLVNLAHPVEKVMDPAPMIVGPDALLSEVAEDLVGGRDREALVVGDDNALLGIITRTNLARGHRRRVILLDHNELAQSAAGVDEASVIEIVDHHRVGDVQTATPILFLNLPVGSTATIVAERYGELGITPPAGIAGIMLSAVLTDTVLLKSPTTTDTDREVVPRLASLAGVNVETFGMEMFRSRATDAPFDAQAAVRNDMKEYRIGDAAIAIAQVETVDAGEYLERGDEIAAALEALRDARGLDMAMLLVTDVVREGSEVFAAGKVRIAERGLGVTLSSGHAWMDGVLSRKKQVAARLLEGLGG